MKNTVSHDLVLLIYSNVSELYTDDANVTITYFNNYAVSLTCNVK